MRHEKITQARAWRASPARVRPALGVISAFVFNVCLLMFALASAFAIAVITRDSLYAYEYSPAGARAIRARVERLNGDLIPLNFDRLRQWDDLVALELMARDVEAARGVLLSARGMLPARVTAPLNRHARNDAALELAALDLLTPGTRARYEALVPLLSRRSASAEASRLPPAPPADPRDFELMAHALVSDPSTGASPFVLAGINLGLTGEITPRIARGVAALAAAARRDDYPTGFAAEMDELLSAAAPTEAFRAAALAQAGDGEAGAFENAAAGFRAAVNPAAAAEARLALEEIGAMSEATSLAGAAALITQAQSLRDLPKLRLIAQAAGARAAVAAKRLPRDGRLVDVARGQLTVTRDLAMAAAAAFLAFAGLLTVLGAPLYLHGRDWLERLRRQDDYENDLVDLSRTWRPL